MKSITDMLTLIITNRSIDAKTRARAKIMLLRIDPAAGLNVLWT